MLPRAMTRSLRPRLLSSPVYLYKMRLSSEELALGTMGFSWKNILVLMWSYIALIGTIGRRERAIELRAELESGKGYYGQYIGFFREGSKASVTPRHRHHHGGKKRSLC